MIVVSHSECLLYVCVFMIRYHFFATNVYTIYLQFLLICFLCSDETLCLSVHCDVCTGVGCCFPVEACRVVKLEFMFQTGWHGV